LNCRCFSWFHWLDRTKSKSKIWNPNNLSFVVWIGEKDASETLEEQQRSRVLHVRREAKTRIWDTEREVGEGLHQALRCVLPLPQIPNRSHELPQGPSLLQRVHSPVPLVSEERHSKVSIRCLFFFVLCLKLQSLWFNPKYMRRSNSWWRLVEIGDT